MSDNEQEPTPQVLDQTPPPPTTMPTTEPDQTKQQDLTKKLDKMSISLSIWPPTQRTREAVVASLVKTLSAPSILSKRYGSLSVAEASSLASVIEDESFSAANSAAPTVAETTANADEPDGIEILQIYSREISKRMLDSVKAKAAATGSANSTGESESENGVEEDKKGPVAASADVPADASEDISSSVETEAS